MTKVHRRRGRGAPAPASPDDALLAGASGLVGHELARQWKGPGTLHALVRRSLPAVSARQRNQVVDFAQLGALPRAGSAYCCLGTTIKTAGSQAAFRAVDFDAVLAFARAAQAAGVNRFVVVSALGADARSSNFYSRTKGEMEAALRKLGFGQLVIARPSLLAGERAKLDQPARPGEVLALALTRPLAWAIPKAWRPIDAAVVARALLRAEPAAGEQVTVLDSAALLALGAQVAP